MTLFEPWAHETIRELWEKLRTEMRKSNTVGQYAQDLRQTGHSFALATARTGGGSFSSSYNYVIKLKNVRTFYWGRDFQKGEGAPFTHESPRKHVNEIRDARGKINLVTTLDVDDDYLVLNADTVDSSTFLGFGHRTETYEVTLFHDLPLECVESCNGQPIDRLGIWTKERVKDLQDSAPPQVATPGGKDVTLSANDIQRAKKLLR